MNAGEIRVEALPDKSFYRPGEAVRLHVTATGGARVTATVTTLTETTAELTASLVDGRAELTWQPPPDAPRGYGLELTLYDAGGAAVATTSTAFDVLERWLDAPRYGFFSDFTPERAGDDETITWLLRHHINGLQFYDWQYRWEDLLPDTETFVDGMGRPGSMATVEHLVEMVRARNIAAMPYTAIYGASLPFYETHKDWALVDANGDLIMLGDFLAIVDPSPGSAWNEHLLAEFADVLDNTNFDGIHIDQYGSPKIAYDADGSRIDLADVFPQFINQTAALVAEKRGGDGAVFFNSVGNYPVETVAPSQMDSVYIEVWSPYTDYLDLHRIIFNAQALSGNKPVIIAAYIPPVQAINWRLANAVVFASGATYIETGEPHALLQHPYFPQYGTIPPESADVLRRYYDFIVRYENVISTHTTPAPERASAVRIEGVRTRGVRAKNTVTPIVRVGDSFGFSFETFSLINFVGIDGSDWNAETTVPPTALSDLAVNIDVTRDVRRVWTASPDDDHSMRAQPLDFAVNDGVLSFTLPHLHTWGMIVVEYADEA